MLRVDCEAITQSVIEDDYIGPEKPTLLSPVDNVVLKNSKPTFKWEPVRDRPLYKPPERPKSSNRADWEKYPVNHGLSRYQIQFDDGEIIDVPAPAYAAMWQTTEYTPPGNLTPGKHKWRVRGVDNYNMIQDGSTGNKSEWSECGVFFIE